MIKLRVVGLILALSGFYSAIAFGADKAPSKHGKGKKADKQEVTYLDLSKADKPESEFPEVVSKGKL